MNNVLLGFSEMDITPVFNVQTVGFGRKDNLSRGILHKLVAQVSIWSLDDEKCCLVTIDSLGFTYEKSNILRGDIANMIGITRDKVMLCFTHTHSAPNISIEQKYCKFLWKQVLLGVDLAVKNAVPIKAACGITEADIGINRRDKHGILDRRVAVLKIVDANTEEMKLLILRITAHGNVLLSDNYFISSDFMGVTRKLLEENYGCKVMITQGASGNVKPRYSGSLKDLDKMALEINRAVAPCIKKLKPRSIEKLSMFSCTEKFFANVPNMKLAKKISDEAMRQNNIDGTNWLKEVQRLNRKNIKKQSREIEIQYFVLDNACLCGVPNEIMCELAVDVVKACNDNFIYFGGYTNGCGGYLANAHEYDRGGYEVLHSYLIYYIYHGIVMPLNRDTADKLVSIVSEKWLETKYH